MKRIALAALLAYAAFRFFPAREWDPAQSALCPSAMHDECWRRP